MPRFDHLLQRFFYRIVSIEKAPEESSTTHRGAESCPPATARGLYSSAESTRWGEDPTADPTAKGWRSFMDGALAHLPDMPEPEKTTPPNLRKRPAIVGITGFPTPRGLLVARGGRL